MTLSEYIRVLQMMQQELGVQDLPVMQIGTVPDTGKRRIIPITGMLTGVKSDLALQLGGSWSGPDERILLVG